MQRFAGLVVVILALSIFLCLAGGLVVSNINDSQTQRINAQANLVVAQGQARLDSAIASQILMTAGLPYVALTIVALLGIGVIGLALVILIKAKPRVINQTAYLAHPAWYVIEEPNTMLIEDKTNKNIRGYNET